jgi:hypothetical protein
VNAGRGSSARPAVRRPASAPTLPTWQRLLTARREGLPEWAARVGVPRVIAACVGLFGLGLVVGVAGAFEHREKAPLGLVVSLLAEGSVVVAAGIHTRSRIGAGLPAGAWVVTALLGAIERPEGDVVITADGLGYAYLLGGLVLMGLLALLPYGGSLGPKR